MVKKSQIILKKRGFSIIYFKGGSFFCISLSFAAIIKILYR